MVKFDLIIVGGGPGGYVAGIRASQLKLNVAIVENKHLGGICLNWGCIPTKALLKNADVLHLVENASKYGINISSYTVNWKKVVKRSQDVARRLSKGIEFLLKKNKITHIIGRGELKSNNKIPSLSNFSDPPICLIAFDSVLPGRLVVDHWVTLSSTLSCPSQQREPEKLK